MCKSALKSEPAQIHSEIIDINNSAEIGGVTTGAVRDLPRYSESEAISWSCC